MDLELIKELSQQGEEEYNVDLNDSLEVPQGELQTGKIFKLEDVIDCFSKPFAIRESGFLVGSTAIHQDGKAHDVDVVLPISDLSQDLQTAIEFRLMRAFSGYFDIPYEEVPKYLQFHEKEVGESPFTSWIPLFKLAIIPTPSEERIIHRMSLDKSNTENFEILEKEKEFIIGGIVSTTAIDQENERLSSKALKEIWNSIKKTPDEFRGLYESHTSTQIGKLLMEYKNRKSALINDKLYLIFKLRDDVPVAKDIINRIKSGELNNFSIKFGVENPDKNIQKVCSDEVCISEILGGTYFLEVSTTESPANEEAGPIEILSKETNNK